MIAEINESLDMVEGSVDTLESNLDSVEKLISSLEASCVLLGGAVLMPSGWAQMFAQSVLY